MLTIALLMGLQAAAAAPDRAEIVGTWRGTSTCTDRRVAPNCHDEVVVFEVRPGTGPGTVAIQADKIVNGERQTMADPFEFAWNADEGCWRHELDNGRFHGVFCLSVKGRTIDGVLRDVPTGSRIRKIALKRD